MPRPALFPFTPPPAVVPPLRYRTGRGSRNAAIRASRRADQRTLAGPRESSAGDGCERDVEARAPPLPATACPPWANPRADDAGRLCADTWACLGGCALLLPPVLPLAGVRAPETRLPSASAR